MSRSSSFNLRKRPRISYYEPQEPNLDEYVFCTDCADFVFEYCSIHGPLLVIPDDKVPAKHSVPAIVPRAALTIPHVFLHLARSRIPGAGIGVFTTLTLPRGVRFGPYRGQRTDEINSMYCWQIYGNDNRASHVIDAGDPRRSNWMRYVNCSRHWFEQNLIAYQYQGQIYYRTTRIIPRFTELLVFYGSEFANRLGVDLKRYNAPPSFAGKLGTQLKKSALVQNRLVSPAVKQQEHRNGLEDPKHKVTSTNVVLRNSNTTAKKQRIEKPKDLIRKQVSNKQASMKRNDKTQSKPIIKNNSDTTIDETSQTIKSLSSVKLNNNLASVKDSSLFKAPETIELGNIEINKNDLTSSEDSAVSTTAETVHPVNEMQLNNNNLISAKHINKTFKINSIKLTSVKTSALRNNSKTVQSAIDHKLNINKFETNSNLNKVDVNVVYNILHCEICPFETNDENQLNNHLRAHAANKSFNCDKCYYKTVDLNHLKQHNRIHTGEKPYSCTVCSKAFTQQSSLKKHLRIHTGEKPYSCTVCSKAFTQQSSLKEHLRIHTGEKPYCCTVCSKAFTQQGHLKDHLRIHTGEKPYSCTVCSKAFNLQGKLKNHLRIHTDEKPYSCTVCSKAFTQQSSLKEHLRIHTGEKPYSCTVCSKAFTQQSNLKKHLRVHTGEKPYSCTVCSKAFTQQINLKKHLRVHTGEKPYCCTVCSKAFSRQSSLKEHLRVHTGEKPYVCDICRRGFTVKKSLRTHLSLHC